MTAPSALRRAFLYLSLAGCAVCCRPHAPHLVDPRSPEEKRWDEIHDLENEGRVNDALDGYLSLCNESPSYTRACFDRARLLFEVGDVEKARTLAVELISRYPNGPFTLSAVKRLARSYLDGNAIKAGRMVMTALAKPLKDTEIWDTLVFEAAHLAREEKDVEGETFELTRLVNQSGRWQSQLWDDAVWRLAEINRQTGRTDEEVRWLTKLKDAQESSRLIGSYTSPFYDDALLRLGEIHLSRNDFDRARIEFGTLSQLSTSRKNDDGLLGLARVDLAEGRILDACAKLAEVQRQDGSAKRRASKLWVREGCEK